MPSTETPSQSVQAPSYRTDPFARIPRCVRLHVGETSLAECAECGSVGRKRCRSKRIGRRPSRRLGPLRRRLTAAGKFDRPIRRVQEGAKDDYHAGCEHINPIFCMKSGKVHLHVMKLSVFANWNPKRTSAPACRMRVQPAVFCLTIKRSWPSLLPLVNQPIGLAFRVARDAPEPSCILLPMFPAAPPKDLRSSQHPKTKPPLERGAEFMRIGERLSSAHRALQFECECLAHWIDGRGGRDRQRGHGDPLRREDRASPYLVGAGSRTGRGLDHSSHPRKSKTRRSGSERALRSPDRHLSTRSMATRRRGSAQRACCEDGRDRSKGQ